MSISLKGIARMPSLQKTSLLRPILIQVLLLIIPTAYAEVGRSDVTLHGTLVVVDCKINDGKNMTVDFGNAVGVHLIDGSRYKQPVPMTVTCDDPGGGDIPPLTLKFSGTPTDFDKAAVTTTVNGLGIELQKDGVALDLDKSVSFDYAHVPQLSAVPVLKPGTELKAQPFRGGVKLIVEVA